MNIRYSVRKILEIRKPNEERIMAHIEFLRKSQYWPIEKMREFQLMKLKGIISYAYSYVPYYHNIFKKLNLKPEDIRTLEDIKKVPILSKSNIKTSLSDVKETKNPERAIMYRTGGSTGEPLKFYNDKTMLSWGSAARYRSWEWVGYFMGDRCSSIWGSSFDINENKGLKPKFFNYINRYQLFNAFNMSDESMREYATEMRAYKPKILRGYGSALYVYAKFVEENQIKGIEPKSIITTAETLHAHQRKKIQDVFGCPVYDGYGSRETSL